MNTRRTNKKFRLLVQQLESEPRLKGKRLSSLLITPVQRLPRYKLLVEALNKEILKANDLETMDTCVCLQKGKRLIHTLETVSCRKKFIVNLILKNF